MIHFIAFNDFTSSLIFIYKKYINININIHFISEATSGFRTTDEEEIKFECTVENFVKHAKRDVKKEKEKGKINNEENANND